MAEHLNWARKYRPKNLSEYMGQSIKNRVMQRLSDESLYPRIWCLYGDRGSGKTSLARLIAVEMLCEDKMDGHSCGKCEMCRELQENLLYNDSGSTTPNVIEVDVATDGGKSAIEEIMSEMDIEPLYGKYKICILDECHRLTQQAQNSLLKRLEEPKAYEIYILCTTEPDKLLQPVRSRCEISIAVKPATLQDLVNRLLFICEKEGIETSEQALVALSNAKNRNPRETILKLEDIAKSNNYKVLLETVLKETGTVEADTYIDYFNSANSSLSDIIKFCWNLQDINIQPRDFLVGLSKFVISCLHIVEGLGLERFSSDYITKVKSFFKYYTPQDVDILLQIIEYAIKSATNSSDMGEYILITTAMRIGKIKLLEKDLSNEKEVSIKETNNGNKLRIEEINKPVYSDKEEDILDSALLTATFGKEVAEIKSDKPMSLDIDDEDEESLSDDNSFIDSLMGM